MTKTSLLGLVLVAFGMGMGAAFVHKGVAFTMWVGIAVVGPVGLGALLFDYAELGPLAQKLVSRWSGGNNGLGNG